MITKCMLWLAAVMLTSIFCVAFCAVTTSAQEVMTNQSVVELVKKGMSDTEIVALVRSSKSSKFDVSLAGVEDLRKAGVSKDVIRELEEKSKVSPDFPRDPQVRIPNTGPAVPGPVPGICQDCVRYRVVATGFVVTTGTTESAVLMDGRGDEVFVAGNFVEFTSDNRIIGQPGSKRSVNYGDTDGQGAPVAIVGGALNHTPLQMTVRAGSAQPHGGLLANDRFPPTNAVPQEPRNAHAYYQHRFIPMTLWEGDLRAGDSPTGVLIFPTIWENDNIADMWEVWNRQAGDYFHLFVRNSSGFFTGARRRNLLEQIDNVLEYAPTRNDYSRPIGIAGDAFGAAASPNPATFIPASMLLTFEKAEEAVRHGEYIITYHDGVHFGPGEYKLMVRVERVGR
jgi:hypothetical protein